jgi:hypothetical protein
VIKSHSDPAAAPQARDFTRIRLTDHNYSSVVGLQRARLKREHPDRSAAKNDEEIFAAILDLMGDPAWEGVQ